MNAGSALLEHRSLPRLARRLLAAASGFLYLASWYLAVPALEEGVRLRAELAATVWISLLIMGAAAAALIPLKGPALRALLFLLALFSAVILGYSLEAYLTLKLCLGASLMLAGALAFPWPWNLAADAAALAALAVFQHPSSLLGETLLVSELPSIAPAEELAFVAALFAVALAGSLAAALADRLGEAEEAVDHLDVTIDRLSQFNQDLQRYARVADEEAITKERHRISREIHDISGYIFTNLIALMDAAVSMGGREPEKLAELHAAARAQAREGLQETRRALRELRASDSHRERGIAAIFKIKTVFERVTGIRVSVETGNIPTSFGDEIDMVVYRIVQEAMTNAMRHGRATAVSVLFWINEGSLDLCVQDDGVGAKSIAKGIGLSGMEERVGRLGGSVKAANAPEGGFRLQVRIPLPARFRIGEVTSGS